MSPIFRKSKVKTRYRIEPDHLAMLVWIAIAFILLCLNMLFSGFGAQSRTHVLNGLAPFVYTVTLPFQALGSSATSMMEIADLRRDNKRLDDENKMLLAWYHKAQRLEAENDRLKELNNVVDDRALRFITARVIIDHDQSFARTALINAGLDDGVQTDQAVLSQYALIGRVMDVGDEIAKIMLVTDINSRVPVMIEGIGQKAILAGRNNPSPELLYIPRDVIVRAGSRIVTSGHGGIFPPNIPIGTIDNATDQKITIRLFADFGKLHLVRVADYNIAAQLPIRTNTPTETEEVSGNSRLVVPQDALGQARIDDGQEAQ